MAIIIRPPTSNVDKLEGAVEHLFQVCGVLNDVSIDKFVQKYARLRKKRLPEHYGTEVVIPRMKQRRIIYQVGHHRFSLNPCYTKDPKGQAAFWVFFENMDGVDLETLQRSDGLSSMAYVKNGRFYQIICCEGNGKRELAIAAQKEIVAEQQARKLRQPMPDERYFFVFSSIEDAKNAPFSLKSPTMFVVVSYEKGTRHPVLTFLRPDEKQRQNAGGMQA